MTVISQVHISVVCLILVQTTLLRYIFFAVSPPQSQDYNFVGESIDLSHVLTLSFCLFPGSVVYYDTSFTVMSFTFTIIV